MRAWTNSWTHVATEPPDQQCGAAGGGDPLGLDDALAPLADQAEPGEEGAEDAELDEHAGHEEGVGVGGAELLDERLEQRAEQEQVEDRLDHADDHPRGVAQVHPQLAAEDDVALAQEPHVSSPSRTWTRSRGRQLGVRSGLGIAQRAAREGEEDVVQGRSVHLDRGQRRCRRRRRSRSRPGTARPAAGPGRGRGCRRSRPRRSPGRGGSAIVLRRPAASATELGVGRARGRRGRRRPGP